MNQKNDEEPTTITRDIWKLALSPGGVIVIMACLFAVLITISLISVRRGNELRRSHVPKETYTTKGEGLVEVDNLGKCLANQIGQDGLDLLASNGIKRIDVVRANIKYIDCGEIDGSETPSCGWFSEHGLKMMDQKSKVIDTVSMQDLPDKVDEYNRYFGMTFIIENGGIRVSMPNEKFKRIVEQPFDSMCELISEHTVEKVVNRLAWSSKPAASDQGNGQTAQ